MSTSATAGLSEPEGTDKISIGTLGYIRTRNKQRAYNLVIKEFKKSGLRNADLAKRLGKAPEVVHRLLSRPQNWGIDTLSDLLFAISGAVLRFSSDHPLESAVANSSWRMNFVKINQSNSTEQHIRFERPEGVFLSSADTTDKVAA